MEFIVTLYRDSLTTLWGFRLEGGRDFNAPLSVQRVFPGTPASSDLLRGDMITSIHNEDATFLYHQEANELIKTSGGSLQLGVKRSNHDNVQFQPFQSYKKSLGYASPLYTFSAPNSVNIEDASTKYRSHAIEKYKNPKPIFSQTGSLHVPTYQPFTLGECSSVQRYAAAKTLPNSKLSLAKPSYPRFNSTNHSPAPYIDRRMIGNIQQNLTRAVHAPNSNFPVKGASPMWLPKNTMQVGKFEVKSFGNMTDNFVRGNSQSSVQSQNSVPHQQVKQYNSPIGLYSNNTLKEEYQKQVQASNANMPSLSDF